MELFNVLFQRLIEDAHILTIFFAVMWYVERKDNRTVNREQTDALNELSAGFTNLVDLVRMSLNLGGSR